MLNWILMAVAMGFGPATDLLGKYVTGEMDLARFEKQAAKLKTLYERQAENQMAATAKGKQSGDAAVGRAADRLVGGLMEVGNPAANFTRATAASERGLMGKPTAPDIVSAQTGLPPETVRQLPSAYKGVGLVHAALGLA